jgi:hypothetical protein
MARFTMKRKAFSCSKAEYKREGNKLSIKRKTFGVAEAAQNVIGGAAETAGNIADTKIGGLAGGLATGGAIQSALGIGMGPIGWLIGAGLGAAATRAAGKGLKSVGESIKAD